MKIQYSGDAHLSNRHRHGTQLHREDGIDAPLYVITPIFNPQRYRTRWKHYNNFEKHILDSGAYLVTIECAFGERKEVYKTVVNDRHTILHVRTTSEIWLKENLINLAAQHLPTDWKYMAWIDADIHFLRHDWVGETLHQLQHYHVVQMFSVALDVDPNHIPYGINYSFMHDYVTGVPDKAKKNNIDACYYDEPCSSGLKINRWHPGFAWAIRRQAFNDLGGLVDWAILGSADNHMARALIGQVGKSVPNSVQPEYRKLLETWQERAERYINRNVGYVAGTIHHMFHGAKANRRYLDRWQILTKNENQPSLDLKKDWQGLYQLTERNYKLRDDIRNYFRQRDEDNSDMKGVVGFL
jgi:hypothetical protein